MIDKTKNFLKDHFATHSGGHMLRMLILLLVYNDLRHNSEQEGKTVKDVRRLRIEHIRAYLSDLQSKFPQWFNMNDFDKIMFELLDGGTLDVKNSFLEFPAMSDGAKVKQELQGNQLLCFICECGQGLTFKDVPVKK